jgi:hypothetical protein
VAEELFRYPNLFEVESIPRRWIQTIALLLADAIISDDRS